MTLQSKTDFQRFSVTFVGWPGKNNPSYMASYKLLKPDIIAISESKIQI